MKYLIFLLLFGCYVPAASVFEQRAKYAMKARSKTDLTRGSRDFIRLSHLRMKCRAQILKDHLPISCYELVSIERKYNFIKKTEYQQQIHHLDSLCLGSQFTTVEFNKGSLEMLSTKCKSAYREFAKKDSYAHPEKSILDFGGGLTFE